MTQSNTPYALALVMQAELLRQAAARNPSNEAAYGVRVSRAAGRRVRRARRLARPRLANLDGG